MKETRVTVGVIQVVLCVVFIKTYNFIAFQVLLRARFISVAQENPDFLRFTVNFSHLAPTSPFDDETMNNLFWIRANYHHYIDLPDTSGLNWRKAIFRCLESVVPWFRTQPDPNPEPLLTVEISSVHSADVEGPPATTSEPEPVEERTLLTLAPEEKLQCESVTPAAMITEAEDWLMDLSAEVLTPTLSHLVPVSSLLFKESSENEMDCDLTISLTCMDCVILTVVLSRFILSEGKEEPAAAVGVEVEHSRCPLSPWRKQSVTTDQGGASGTTRQRISRGAEGGRSQGRVNR